MGIRSHDEDSRLDKYNDEFSNVLGRMNEDGLIESNSKFPQSYLKRRYSKTVDKLLKDISALTKYRVQKSVSEIYSRIMSALTKKSIFQKDGAVSFMKHLLELEDIQRRLTDVIKNVYKSKKSIRKRASNKNPGNGAESHIQKDTWSESDNSILQNQDLQKEIKIHYKDNSDGTGDTLLHGLSVGKGNSIHTYCTIITKGSSPLETDHNDRIKTSVFSIYFQLISLMFNYLLASTLDYLDERTYSQTDLVLYEANPRGRRKYSLFTRFWMVTRDLFSNAIALTAHISNIYYTGIYPTDCRMNLYLPCLIGNYLHEKDEIDDRLAGQLMLNTQGPINGQSSYLTDCINPRINP